MYYYLRSIETRCARSVKLSIRMLCSCSRSELPTLLLLLQSALGHGFCLHSCLGFIHTACVRQRFAKAADLGRDPGRPLRCGAGRSRRPAHVPMHPCISVAYTLPPSSRTSTRTTDHGERLPLSLSLYLSISLSISLLTDDGRPPVDGPWRFLIYERLTACGRLGKGARNSRLSASHPAGHPEGSRTGAGRRKALVPNFRNWFCMRAVFSSPGLFPVTCGVIRNSTIVCVC